LLARVVVRDRGLRGALGRLADEHCARLRCALDARGGIDEIARHHALVLSAERHGCFAGEDSRADAQVGVERWHGRNQLERGPDGTLGVVLPRDRCPPDSHHGVADELLHRTPVPLDGQARDVEIARQQLSRVLGVSTLRRGGEAD
jgi:hypothetical protein